MSRRKVVTGPTTHAPDERVGLGFYSCTCGEMFGSHEARRVHVGRMSTTWCLAEWCHSEADVYLDGGAFWWPACEAHRATVATAVATGAGDASARADLYR